MESRFRKAGLWAGEIEGSIWYSEWGVPEASPFVLDQPSGGSSLGAVGRLALLSISLVKKKKN